MRNFFLLSFITLLLITLKPAQANAAVVGDVRVKGNVSISENQVIAVVRTRSGELFDADIAAQDSGKIAEIDGIQYSYYNIEEAQQGKVNVTFVVVEQNLIRGIEFNGNKKYKDKLLRKKTGFKVGDYLDKVLCESATVTITDFYKSKGYPFIEVGVKTELFDQGRLVYDIKEGSRIKIGAVKFEGTKGLRDKEIKKALKTKKRKWLLFSGLYIEEKLGEDIAKIENIYYDHGYLDVKVDFETVFNDKKRKATVIFKIDEGHEYHVSDLQIRGNDFFEPEKLSELVNFEKGQVYSQAKAKSSHKRLLAIFKESGFVDAEVDKIMSFAGSDKVSVIYNIEQGKRFRIAQVNITGNQDTQDKVVRRVLDEYDFTPGNWYNADIAKGDGQGFIETLVKRSVLMESVTITPSESGSEDSKNAEVAVIEGQTGSIMLGAGLSSDSGAIGQVVYNQKNFDIKDKPESFSEFISGKAYKGAGQNLRILLEPGTEYSYYAINFTEPYLYDEPISLNVVASSFEREWEAYTESRMSGSLALQKRYKSKWRRGIAFRAESVNVEDLDIDAPKEIVDVKGRNLLFGTRLSVSKDMTNNPFEPSKGHFFETGYEQVFGDFTFGVADAKYVFYKTLKEDLAERKTVLSSKLEGAAIIGNAPPYEKFYAGGSKSLRGFEFRGVSTRGLQRNVANPKRKDPVGSDWLLLANTEVVFPLVGKNVSWLAFVDSGMIDSGGVRSSIGLGFQIMIPQWFGPVPMRFEVAAPFMKDGEDDTQIFSFSMGKLF